uniref:zf-TFIIB domain-containing protein n=1 Tax=Thaumasiovibrio occultus TaxID=1891184 RepID=UPI000B34D574|nr:zf-TFIIB domain-containing protein [Thaumasiovibrio occultus]
MKCPKCKDSALHAKQMDEQFAAQECERCGGDWILVEDFVQWRENNPGFEFAKNVDVEEDEILDSQNALLCPRTGTFMRKFRIAAQNAHRLDYSAAVGGIWLDNGEWELLKKEGIAGQLNEILTNKWQQAVRESMSKEQFALIYSRKFGETDYQKVRDIRGWIDSHPAKADLRAYLFAEDPYSAER